MKAAKEGLDVTLFDRIAQLYPNRVMRVCIIIIIIIIIVIVIIIVMIYY